VGLGAKEIGDAPCAGGGGGGTGNGGSFNGTLLLSLSV